MVDIKWTDEAKSCLKSIFDYISEENPTAAESVTQGIFKKVQILRQHPRLGQRYERIEDREVREIIYGHYRIPYLILNEFRIDILGVFHGAMNIDEYLK